MEDKTCREVVYVIPYKTGGKWYDTNQKKFTQVGP